MPWLLASPRHSRHDIDNVNREFLVLLEEGFQLPVSMWRNVKNVKCKNMFMYLLKNFACKGLIDLGWFGDYEVAIYSSSVDHNKICHNLINKITIFQWCFLDYFNSFGPSDAIWRQRSGSTLAQVMACCLTAPSHYLNQCSLMISKIQSHSSNVNFTRDTSVIND